MLRWPNTTLRQILLIGFIFIIGIGAGWIFARHFEVVTPRNDTTHYLRLSDEHYPLINQLLACNINESNPSETLSALNATILEDINQLTASKDISRAGVYLRNLENGIWTSVNGDDLFVPASLMKIVKLIAFLNQADQDPAVLDRLVTIPLNLEASAQNIAPTATAIRGETYTVRELLQLAIIHSDNIAVNALTTVIDQKILNETLNDLEIPDYSDLDEGRTYTISPRLYSRFFRVLYNSTLLSPEHSELALEWLAQSEYKEALVKGVNDPTISIAHKFGETITLGDSDTPVAQHHDCGIVYAPTPYAVCIMTEGSDLSRLAHAIARIESDIHTFITK